MRVFARHAKRYPVAVFLGAFLTALAIVCDIFLPLYYKRILDTASAASMPTHAIAEALISILIVAMALLAARQAARRGGSFANTYFQPKIMNDLSQSAFRYMQDHSYAFFTNSFTGSLVRRVTRLSKSFEDLADRLTGDLIPLAVSLTGITIVLFLRNPLLGSIFLTWLTLFIIMQFAISRWKMRFNLDVSEADSETTGALSDSISNNITVKLFAGEAHERRLFGAASDVLARKRFLSWGVDEIVSALQATLMVLLELALMITAIKLWEQGLLTVGDFALIQAYVISAVEGLWSFGTSLRKLYESFADATEMVDIMNMPHEVEDAADARELVVRDGAIAFSGVDFSFTNDRKVFESFDLSIAAREKVALVGPSGAGKTTITKLLVRFHDVQGGSITIDGQDIKAVTQESLRRSIAFVPQEPTLFHRTLMENIRYGRLDATDEEVIATARKANCYDFIQQTPEGFGTFVGERGIKLSGGERQRVAVARAILKDAPILILDEATSSLDSESEALIQEALARLMEGKTVIAIAHRLSTVMKMDRIVVIEDGKVATTGTHAQLIAHEGGLYKKLWEIQAGGFLADDLG
jgi:ATP-binding cassette subfamily B protein